MASTLILQKILFSFRIWFPFHTNYSKTFSRLEIFLLRIPLSVFNILTNCFFSTLFQIFSNRSQYPDSFDKVWLKVKPSLFCVLKNTERTLMWSKYINWRPRIWRWRNEAFRIHRPERWRSWDTSGWLVPPYLMVQFMTAFRTASHPLTYCHGLFHIVPIFLQCIFTCKTISE